MEIETFSWSTPAGATGTPAFGVLSAQFGDGYKQTAADGINNKRTSWAMTFTGSAEYISTIKAFLDKHKAVRSFYWTPPLEPQMMVKGKYTYSHKGGAIHALNVTFEQDFRP